MRVSDHWVVMHDALCLLTLVKMRNKIDDNVVHDSILEVLQEIPKKNNYLYRLDMR